MNQVENIKTERFTRKNNLELLFIHVEYLPESKQIKTVLFHIRWWLCKTTLLLSIKTDQEICNPHTQYFLDGRVCRECQTAHQRQLCKQKQKIMLSAFWQTAHWIRYQKWLTRLKPKKHHVCRKVFSKRKTEQICIIAQRKCSFCVPSFILTSATSYCLPIFCSFITF